MRHLCTQEDKMSTYAYTKHSITYASQQIHDESLSVKLKTEFTTSKSNWGVRINGEQVSQSFKINTLFYITGNMRVEPGVLIGERNGNEFRIEHTGIVFGIHVPKDQEYRMTDHLNQRFQRHATQGGKGSSIEDILVFKERNEPNSNVTRQLFCIMNSRYS